MDIGVIYIYIYFIIIMLIFCLIWELIRLVWRYIVDNVYIIVLDYWVVIFFKRYCVVILKLIFYCVWFNFLGLVEIGLLFCDNLFREINNCYSF